MTWVTPYSQDTDFTRPLSFDAKVRIFRERTLGWQLDIADACINGREFEGGKEGPITHSGYAVLQIILNCFEMIAKMKDGFAGAGNSERYFCEGVRNVVPPFKTFKHQSIIEDLLKILYRSGRCGLYDSAVTEGRIGLRGDGMPAMLYDGVNKRLMINPHMLIPHLREHLKGYVKQLQDPTNIALRENFEKRFDYLASADPLKP